MERKSRKMPDIRKNFRYFIIMKTFFTADTHFCHKNIIAFCKRPFASVEEMNEAMIVNWNSVVGDDDDVWVLGDFAFGNHDDDEVIHLPWAETPLPYTEIKLEIGGVARTVVLSHYPMRSWNHMYRGSFHLFGHEHGRIRNYDHACDVGADCWDYRPVSFDTVLLRMQTAEKNPDPH